MIKNTIIKNDFKEGLEAALPIVVGYVPIAMTFGMLSKSMDISILHSLLFSALVYAGASQFMALNLLALGVGIGEIILATLLVNFRHFLMSASLSVKMEENNRRWISTIAFGVTDETFSIASFKGERATNGFIMGLHSLSYFSWILGTFLGYIIGELLSNSLRNSMQVALYAMFIAILVPEAKKSNRAIGLALLSGITNTLLNYLDIFPSGWNMMVSIVLVSFIGCNFSKRKEVALHE